MTSFATRPDTVPRFGGAAGRPLQRREILVVLSGLMSGMLVSALTQTIVFTALPTIVGELGGLDKISWVATATLLTTTASMPLYGKLSDLHGRKLLFQIAIVILIVSSALAGFAQNIWHLIVARAVQGLGAGGLMTLSQAIIGDIVPPRERGRYQGYMMSVLTASTVAGPLLGGFLVDALSWRWVFAIPLPFGIVALVITQRVLKLQFEKVRHPIDYLGSTLLVTGVSCLILSMLWGGTRYAWGSATIVGLGTGAAVVTALFIWRQRRAPEPLLPARLFRNSVLNVTNAAGFLLGVAFFGGLIFLPVFLQVVTGVSATLSGSFMVPLAGGLTATSIFSGRVISRIGRYKGFALLGSALMALSLVLMSQMDTGTTGFAVGVYMVVLGFGLGMLFPVLIVAAQNAVDWRDLGTATASLNFFRSMGSTVGIALFGAIMTNRLGYHLRRLVPPDSLAGIDPVSLRGSPAQIRTLPPQVREGVVQSFALSMQAIFAAAIPIAIGAFVILLFLKELPLRERSFVEGTEDDTGAEEEPTPSSSPGSSGPGSLFR